MKLALIGVVLAWLAVFAGVTLAVHHAQRKRPPLWLLWVHPVLATATVVYVWLAVALWPGASNRLFNSGALVISLAFVAGAFIFSLRVSGLRPPVFVTGLHGAVAVAGCVLLIVGLLHFSG